MKRLFPFIFLFLFNSCFDQNDCITTATNLVKIELFTRGGVAQKKKFTLVQRDAFGNKPAQRFPVYDSSNIGDIGGMILPLDPDTTQNSFTLQTNVATYHLSLKYDTYTRVISTECGAFLYYNNLKVDTTQQRTTFDSTRVVEPELFKAVTSNVKVFF